MKVIQKEFIIAFEEDKSSGHQFSPNRVVVRVVEEPCGFWLGITGYNDEYDETEEENEHEFYLQSIEEIDQFACILKKTLLDVGEKPKM